MLILEIVDDIIKCGLVCAVNRRFICFDKSVYRVGGSAPQHTYEYRFSINQARRSCKDEV